MWRHDFDGTPNETKSGETHRSRDRHFRKLVLKAAEAQSSNLQLSFGRYHPDPLSTRTSVGIGSSSSLFKPEKLSLAIEN
jgi:hypothetical protein